MPVRDRSARHGDRHESDRRPRRPGFGRAEPEAGPGTADGTGAGPVRGVILVPYGRGTLCSSFPGHMTLVL